MIHLEYLWKDGDTLDKEEFRTKLEEINNLVEKKDYKGALDIVDSIEWRRVKSIRTLCKVGEIYAANKRYEDSKDILLLAYHKASIGKSILYRLIEVCLRMGNVHEAEEFLEEFKESAPNDNTRYILEYKISKARKSPIEEQIKILEDYKETEFTERWSYELARLYEQAGEKDKCIEICNDLILWFSEGKYVMKAMELKMKFGKLTPAEHEKYKKQLMPELKKPEPIEHKKEESEEKEETEKEETSSDSEETEEKEQPINREDRQAEDIVTPIMETTEAFQEKIANSIKEIFGNKPATETIHEKNVEEEADEQRTINNTENSREIIEDVPELEPETIEEAVIENEEPLSEPEEVTVESVQEEPVQEETELSDLEEEPKEQESEEPEEEEDETESSDEKNDEVFNMEDLILAATTAQGIEVPMEEESPKSEPEEEIQKEPEEPEEPETEDPEEAKEKIQEETLESLEEKSLKEDSTIDLKKIISRTFSEEDAEKPQTEEKQEIEKNLETEEKEEIFQEEAPVEEKPEELKRITETEEEFLDNYFRAEEKPKDVETIIPREKKLTEEEEKIFTYFVKIPGMKEQIAEALYDVQISASDKTSKVGNVIVMGNKGSGKTRLIESFVPAVCKELHMEAAKVAYVTAEQINGKDVARIVDKLSGGFLVIEEANKMEPETVEQLNKAMEFRTDGLTVIIEDEKIGMRKLIAKYPKFAEKFTSMINIPVFTNDELVNFAKVYTAENGYTIDQMGMLALYNLIGDNQKEDEPMTVERVKELIDAAVEKADSGARKLKRNIAKKRTDAEGNIILYEKDFN
ncbi:hypothetical protein B5F53_13680 [Blautia sp. An249]|uniref:ATP-binding protein n=1 Tax=Blautia sp. An249 TaxID=1965603 RepID=UPI000B3A5E96|nr:ATP-binding protein [Blautia sp. An249]OUO77424.1 hypothetical protein B5F53_13680 [Blautia sp. An249]